MSKDATPEPLLRLESVDKSFRMGEVTVKVLRGLSLTIDVGEFLTVIGPSGSGKTTLLNLIGGLDQPTAGRVWYRNRELSAMAAAELAAYRRDEVGFVFQLYNLIPNLTAEENVSVATEISAEPMDALEAIDLVGLSERHDHFPSQLSGGEQQRVAIARAIATRPKLLLCDEPTGALDFTTGRQVLSLLSRLNRELQTTVVIITHNTALAQISHRSIHLSSGKIADTEIRHDPTDPMEITW